MPTIQLERELVQNAETVWRTVGSFAGYEWGAGVGPAVIEDGRPDNEVGSIRAFDYYGSPGRQRLVSHSDAERTYSWESLEPYEDIEHYVQTISVEPVSDGRSLMTWRADFIAPDDSVGKWSPFFQSEFAKSFDKLAAMLATR